mmetsp:Transcript_32847/g.78614  ORF Transcript_32847/g.78614 Transcript_32847/m.78614 type:complete len:367 (-) Transcript_32847:24-1124(-)
MYHLSILVELPEKSREQHATIKVGVEDGGPVWVVELHLDTLEEVLPRIVGFGLQHGPRSGAELLLEIQLRLFGTDEARPQSDEHGGRSCREGKQCLHSLKSPRGRPIAFHSYPKRFVTVAIWNSSAYDARRTFLLPPSSNRKLELHRARLGGSQSDSKGQPVHRGHCLKADAFTGQVPGAMEISLEEVWPERRFGQVVPHATIATLVESRQDQEVAVVANPRARLMRAPQAQEAGISWVEPPAASGISRLHRPMVEAPWPCNDRQGIPLRDTAWDVVRACEDAHLVHQGCEAGDVPPAVMEQGRQLLLLLGDRGRTERCSSQKPEAVVPSDIIQRKPVAAKKGQQPKQIRQRPPQEGNPGAVEHGG